MRVRKGRGGIVGVLERDWNRENNGVGAENGRAKAEMTDGRKKRKKFSFARPPAMDVTVKGYRRLYVFPILINKNHEARPLKIFDLRRN